MSGKNVNIILYANQAYKYNNINPKVAAKRKEKKIERVKKRLRNVIKI